MTRIVLLRHAHSVANAKGILAGRTAGITLSERGKEQALEVAARLQGVDFSQIRISPMERCAETVQPLISQFSKAQSRKVAIKDDPDFIEVDYGKWTGRKIAVLSKDRAWKIVQNNPSAMYFPEGEGLLDVQARAMRGLTNLSRTSGTDPKLVVSHGDVIKSIVSSVLGSHLDQFQKIVIDPASITVLDFNGIDYRVLTLNNSSEPINAFLAHPKKSNQVRALIGGGAGLRK